MMAKDPKLKQKKWADESLIHIVCARKQKLANKHQSQASRLGTSWLPERALNKSTLGW